MIFPGIFIVSALIWGASAAAGELFNPWAEMRTPAPGPAQAIGGYAAGCLQGGVSILPDEGEAFQVMRKSRGRYFTHPRMHAFVNELAAEIRRRQFGTLLVGDLGQARGGPTTTGHSSHQSGLDGDFWFWLDSPANERRLSADEVENLSAISMLNEARSGVDSRRFKPKHVALLEYVSRQPEVARIFVHPHIKKALCESSEEAPWLSKVRPWWGHHYHFHVRLECPEGQPECTPQPPPAANPGCGAELDWWFSAEAAERARKAAEAARKLTAQQKLQRKLDKVPPRCQPLLGAVEG